MTPADLPFRIVREHKPRVALGLFLVLTANLLAFVFAGVALFTFSILMVIYENVLAASDESGVIGVALFLFGVSVGGLVVSKLERRYTAAIAKAFRLMAPGGTDAFRRLQRRPVLLLRSFDDDELVSRTAPFWFAQSPNRYEDHLVSALRRAGPTLAIGRPTDVLPQTGALRIYVSDEDWQPAVRYFFKTACLVAVVVGRTTGVTWEILESARHVPPDRLLFVFPEANRQRSNYSLFERKRPARHGDGHPSPQMEKEARFAHFRENLSPLGILQLPEAIGRAQVLVFDLDGSGRFLANQPTIARVFFVLNPLVWLIYWLSVSLWFVPWRLTLAGEVSLRRTLRPIVERAQKRTLPPMPANNDLAGLRAGKPISGA